MPYERPSVESTARPVGGRALVDRFFGGRPLSIILRLVLLSNDAIVRAWFETAPTAATARQ
jgi:hypothetical protein